MIIQRLQQLNDDVLFNEVVSQTKDEISHFKENSGGRDVKLAFWSGAAGMRIEAAELRLFLMSGEIQLSNVALLHSDWWSYWKEYWKKLDTTEALPKDYACEVTIPIKQD